MTLTRKTLSSSTLTGDTVVDRKGEKIGKLEDLMIDVTEGTVGYAVLSFGGFMGIGDKLFAFPWKSLEIDEANKQIVVDVSKERLEDAPGFDKDHWPDFSDTGYRQQVDSYHRG